MIKKRPGKKPVQQAAKKGTKRTQRSNSAAAVKRQQRSAARIAKLTGQPVENVLKAMTANNLVGDGSAPKAKRPYERKNHNLNLMAPAHEGFYLYATTKEKVKYNNRLLEQRLEEVRRMIGVDPGLPYDFDEKMLDDPAWLFRDDDEIGPDDDSQAGATEDDGV